jgi:hypothetical protein
MKTILGPQISILFISLVGISPSLATDPYNSYKGYNSYISIGRCDEWEQTEFERQHLQCTRQVEERYSTLLEKFEVDIPAPLASSNTRNYTKPVKKTQDVSEICNMLHDAVTKCGQVYQQCLTEEEYRQFQDGQIEIFVQLLTTLYSLGPEVNECEIVQEYHRSGRKDVTRPTDKCKEQEVKKLTIRYQQCLEDANYDMTRAMIGHQANFELAFEALCLGIDRVVHYCSDILFDCYTVEEIEETKLGQLELMRKVFLDIIEDTNAPEKNSTKAIHWDFDIKKCHAYYKTQNSAETNFPTCFNMFFLNVIVMMISILHW